MGHTEENLASSPLLSLVAGGFGGEQASFWPAGPSGFLLCTLPALTCREACSRTFCRAPGPLVRTFLPQPEASCLGPVGDGCFLPSGAEGPLRECLPPAPGSAKVTHGVPSVPAAEEGCQPSAPPTHGVSHSSLSMPHPLIRGAFPPL